MLLLVKERKGWIKEMDSDFEKRLLARAPLVLGSSLISPCDVFQTMKIENVHQLEKLGCR